MPQEIEKKSKVPFVFKLGALLTLATIIFRVIQAWNDDSKWEN